MKGIWCGAAVVVPNATASMAAVREIVVRMVGELMGLVDGGGGGGVR